jgi:hypothetical protein
MRSILAFERLVWIHTSHSPFTKNRPFMSGKYWPLFVIQLMN